MNKRTFLKSLLGLLAIPLVGRSESRMERNLRARDEALNAFKAIDDQRSVMIQRSVFTAPIFTDENGKRYYVNWGGEKRFVTELEGTWSKETPIA